MTVTEALQELGLDYREGGQHHHVNHGWVGVDCPRCSPGALKFRLGIKGRAATCWQCGPVPLLAALHELTGRPYGELKLLLGDPDPPPKQERPRGALKVPEGLGPLLAPHRRYLEDRGFDPDELVRLWHLGAYGVHHRLAWRLFVPVTRGGRCVSWTTRNLRDAGRRWVGAESDEEAEPAKAGLYGEDYPRHGVVVVEGPSDAWRVGPGAVATFGMAYTRPQVLRLSKYPVRAVCFDREEAAQAQARRLCRELAACGGKTVNVVLEADDPGSARPREIRELRRQFLD